MKTTGQTTPHWAHARRDMVKYQLERIRDSRVLEAMGHLPRHLFVPEPFTGLSYEDMPLSIGYGQTISQPLMIAIMLEAAELTGSERVLEVGTGSGYQAALLCRLAREVYTIEIIPELVEAAKANLQRAGVKGVHVIAGNGSIGYPAAAPYDAIIVAAGAPSIPEPLVEQLALGGRLLIPVGHSPFQMLVRVRRGPDGVRNEPLDFCAFVPLVGEYGVDADREQGQPG